MKQLLCLLFWLLAPGLLCGGTSLENAYRAQMMLGAGTWARVIRVENSGTHSAYPGTVYGLVFEEGGLLWFYTDTDGTQSLSLHAGRLDDEKADLAPLLREIEPGFSRHAFMPDGSTIGIPEKEAPLPNGCFIDCLAALQARIGTGELITRPRLLSCYVDTPAGRRGHTVLTYETARGFFLLNPARSPQPQQLPREWADDSMRIAGMAMEGAKVARARWVPTGSPAPLLLASMNHVGRLLAGAAPRRVR